MADAEGWPWRFADKGVALKVRVTPKGGRDAIEGAARLGDGQAVLKLRVRAVPEDGGANCAVIALLAEALQMPRSRLAIGQGATNRIKTVHLGGNAAEFAPFLAGVTR